MYGLSWPTIYVIGSFQMALKVLEVIARDTNEAVVVERPLVEEALVVRHKNDSLLS